MASAAPLLLSPTPFRHPLTPQQPPPPTRRRLLRDRPLSCCLSIDCNDESSSTPAPILLHQPVPAAPRVIFTGGGSGGRIYPAIAIADELRASFPDSTILFIGSSSGIESTAAASAGYDYTAVPIARLASPKSLLLPFYFLYSVSSSWKIIRDFRPHVVVGTGGYVAAPVCLAAVLSGARLVIQEQNGFPGLTNRVLAPFAEKVFLAFNDCLKYFQKGKCLVCGNPVRLSIRRYVSKAVARSHFFPKAGSKGGSGKAQVVLVLGGSAGANAINITVLNMYYGMVSEHKNRFIIWQTGDEGYIEMESLVKNHRRLLMTPFLNAMDLAYAAADVVVSRSGAMTCTEILTTGKPSILIPSPDVAGDHQTSNAYIMADRAGSRVLEEDRLDSSSLGNAIDEVLGDENLMAEMSEKALRSARPDAATEIVQCILSMLKLSSPR